MRDIYFRRARFRTWLFLPRAGIVSDSPFVNGELRATFVWESRKGCAALRGEIAAILNFSRARDFAKLF